MLAKELMARIDAYHAECFKTNPFFRAARNGTVSVEDFKRFLANIHHLISHTPIHLHAARQSAMHKGLLPLAGYYKTKLGEEEGHDEWSAADLEGLKARGASNATTADVTPGLHAMLRHNEINIDKDPALYLSHILFAEYFTVIATPPMVDELEKNCGLPRELMSVVRNHAELDKEHVAEWQEEIPKLVNETKQRKAMLASLERTIECYHSFCSDLLQKRKAA